MKKLLTVVLGLFACVTPLMAGPKTAVKVQVVDNQTEVQSEDRRTNGGLIGALSGRRTLTDSVSVQAVINEEHAKLDCFEHRKGCSTIGPGVYDAEMDDKGGVWISYEMPLTHKKVTNHYVVRGSW